MTPLMLETGAENRLRWTVGPVSTDWRHIGAVADLPFTGETIPSEYMDEMEILRNPGLMSQIRKSQALIAKGVGGKSISRVREELGL